jgi:superfamily II DNA or RNA helicase
MRLGFRRTLFVLPTGGGKGVVLAYMAAGAAQKGKRVVIVAHRRRLLQQLSKTLKSLNIRHAVLTPDYHGIPTANVVIASVFTLARRLKRFPTPDLLIVDEAHHCTPDNTWGKVIAHFSSAILVGVTATPERTDGKGLGLVFDNMVVGPSVGELTEQGFLSPVEVYAPPAVDLKGLHTRGGDYVTQELEALMGKAKVTGDAVKHYLTLTPGEMGIAFCVSIKHAEEVAAAFTEAGVPSRAIHGKLSVDEQENLMTAFECGQIKVLTSCDLIGEGVDVPDVRVLIMLRPTKSHSLFRQFVGRGTRIAPLKKCCTLLDHANNTRVHGFIEDDVEWVLSTEAARKKTAGQTGETVRTCPKCFAAHRPAPECPKCGHVYQTKARTVETAEGDLTKLERGSATAPKKVDWQRQFYVLVKQAERMGIKNPKMWAFNVVCNQEAKRAASVRDVPNEPLINGLTAAEREGIREKIGVTL